MCAKGRLLRKVAPLPWPTLMSRNSRMLHPYSLLLLLSFVGLGLLQKCFTPSMFLNPVPRAPVTPRSPDTHVACMYPNLQVSFAITSHQMLARCHLGICIKCRASGVRSFYTCDMTKHLKSTHKDNAHVFYEQLPDLSGMQAEDVSGELAECL